MSELRPAEQLAVEAVEQAPVPKRSAANSLQELLSAPTRAPEAAPPLPAVMTAELLALLEGQPIISWAEGQHTLSARTTVDLHGAHIGSQVLVVFENGDATKPIVTGVLRPLNGWPLPEAPSGTVEVDADGERLVVQAQQQLVLRCGKASITLTKAGKVLIEGAYVLSRSTGVNRIKGGSVQLN